MIDVCATNINHKRPLCVSQITDADASKIAALNFSREGLDGYAYCSTALFPKTGPKNEYLQVKNDCSSTKLSRDELPR